MFEKSLDTSYCRDGYVVKQELKNLHRVAGVVAPQLEILTRCRNCTLNNSLVFVQFCLIIWKTEQEHCTLLILRVLLFLHYLHAII